MDFINNLIKLGGTPTVLCGAFIICLLGYAIGSIKVKGVELGTAGVFLMALLFGYLFTLPGLKDIPVLGSFYIESAKSSAVTSYKFIESIGLVLRASARSRGRTSSATSRKTRNPTFRSVR